MTRSTTRISTPMMCSTQTIVIPMRLRMRAGRSAARHRARSRREDLRWFARRGCARCARGGSLSGPAELRPIMLSLVDVSAGYGSFRALFGVSLEVAAGETVGVIGPNGAGKTTLMRVISGLVAAFDGGITLEGRPILGVPAHRIVERGIAHVPENRRL